MDIMKIRIKIKMTLINNEEYSRKIVDTSENLKNM